MKKITTLFLVASAVLSSTTILSQASLQWAKGWGASFEDAVVSVATDPTGNVYTLSVFSQTVDADPGIGTFTVATKGANDMLITKLDPSGNLIWAKRLGGTGNDDPSALAVDASGNVYSTGYFIGTADFDPGSGTSNLSSTGSSNEIFVSKLDANGNFVWAKSMGGNGTDAGQAIHVDNSGNVYTTGSYNLTADFDPSPTSTFTITSAGGANIFVSKLDMNGNFVWAKSIGGAGGSFSNNGTGITTNAAGDVYTTGNFIKTVDFDPGVGTYTVTCVGGFNNDVFLSKLDMNGNFAWAITIGNSDYDDSFDVKCDGAGDVYITGKFYETVDFDPSSTTTYTLDGASSGNVFVAKYNTTGNLVWAKTMGGTDADAGNNIFIDGNNNILTSGYFQGTADFNPGAGVANLTAGGGSYASVFVSVLDVSGNYVNAFSLASQYSYDRPPSVAVDPMGNIIVGGAFEATSDFDPGAGTFTMTATAASYSDAFVTKIGNVATGINNFNTSSNAVRLFPNPAAGILNVQLTGIDVSKNTSMSLFNSMGQEVRNSVISNEQNTISLEGLSAGIYFYKVKNSNSTIQSGKLIIE
ncbi:MAG: T9SS type A sorting domain-containing protein [Bacteroidota bacterium]